MDIEILAFNIDYDLCICTMHNNESVAFVNYNFFSIEIQINIDGFFCIDEERNTGAEKVTTEYFNTDNDYIDMFGYDTRNSLEKENFDIVKILYRKVFGI